MAAGLQSAIPANAVHLCVDMQRMFVEDTPWRSAWAGRVLPVIVRLCEFRAERVCFTRFVPPGNPEQSRGAWRKYWETWSSMTLDRLDDRMVDLAEPLQRFVPPGRVLDKHVYSPWIGTDLDGALLRASVDTLIVTGAETDVCVLATVLGAADRGYRIVMATDALASTFDQMHDNLMELYRDRYSHQIETAGMEEIVEAWSV